MATETARPWAEGREGAPAPDPAWHRVREHLEAARRRLHDAVASYPAPIAGCDTQFNTLLEEQYRVADERRRLDQIDAACATAAERRAALESFIATSPSFDEDARRAIRALL
ncbi:MAG: hypothetical protein HY423_03925 [Candidatus Lambdaproteobacteria bacterium]|nr:hypothetical protein [Candidatus Lambdaproteobacteria bacterium]